MYGLCTYVLSAFVCSTYKCVSLCGLHFSVHRHEILQKIQFITDKIRLLNVT